MPEMGLDHINWFTWSFYKADPHGLVLLGSCSRSAGACMHVLKGGVVRR